MKKSSIRIVVLTCFLLRDIIKNRKHCFYSMKGWEYVAILE